MIELGRIFEERQNRGLPYRADISDFIEFLGATGENIEVTGLNFAQLENLPGVSTRFRALGGAPYLDKVSFSWVVKQKGEYLNLGERFDGTGLDYNEAALRGLLVAWELMTLRKIQTPTSV